MKVTFIVTIDPVKDPSLLNILIHSLNLQTTKNFNVVFYNQTLMDEGAIFSQMQVKPIFEYTVYPVCKELFFGEYPLWDLYQLHNILLDDGVLHEYFMSLHLEEFLDVDYVENAIQVLAINNFDIMFGGLSRTQVQYPTITALLDTRTREEFDRYLIDKGMKDSCHWSFKYEPLFGSRNVDVLKHNALKFVLFGFRKSLKPTKKGYLNGGIYRAEDVYFMKRAFATRYNWFLRGHPMYFEDIHICEQKGTCELSKELKKITRFPVYFNRRKIYRGA